MAPAPGSPPPGSPLRWFFLGAFVLSAAVAYGLALPLGVGAVLGYITEQRVSSLLDRLNRRSHRRWRDGLTGVFILSTLLLVLLPVGIAIYVAILDLVRLLARIDWSSAAQWAERMGLPLLDKLAALGVEISPEQLRSKAAGLIASIAGAVGGFLGSVLSSTPELLFNALITLLGWFVFATTGQETRDQVLPRLIPWPRVLRILRETTAEVIESVIIANILVSAVQALVCTVPLVVLGVPRALVWGVMSFFLSFIPIIGTVPVTLGSALWCFSAGKTGGAIAMVVVAIVVGSVDNVLRPLFMRSSKVELSTLWLIVALTSGVSLFGVSGVILGPLAFSLFVAFSQALDAEETPATEPPAEEPAPSAPLAPPQPTASPEPPKETGAP
jgi:predicted PurR-regulated permease PerM